MYMSMKVNLIFSGVEEGDMGGGWGVGINIWWEGDKKN